jgi:hypothetical protein
MLQYGRNLQDSDSELKLVEEKKELPFLPLKKGHMSRQT